MHGGGSELAEAAWLEKNPLGAEIGCGRKFETFVFKAGKPCKVKECGCGLPEQASSEIDSLAANDRKTATSNHYKLCKKYAKM